MTSHDSDTVDAPITNEELYVELRRLHRRLVAVGGIAAVSALTVTAVLADVVAPVTATGILTFATLLLLVTAGALRKDSSLRALHDAIPFAPALPDPEPVLEDRLADSKRTDGGQEVSSDE